MELLAFETERLAARREHRDGRTVQRDGCHRSGGRIEYVLAVVHDEERLPSAAPLDDRLERRDTLPWHHPEGGGDRPDDSVGVADGGELDHPRAVTKAFESRFGQLGGRAGLTGSAWPDQRHQTPRRQQLA